VVIDIDTLSFPHLVFTFLSTFRKHIENEEEIKSILLRKKSSTERGSALKQKGNIVIKKSCLFVTQYHPSVPKFKHANSNAKMAPDT